MTLEGEIAPLEACFSYSDYIEAFYPNGCEVDNLQNDMECDSVDIDVNISSGQEQCCKRKRGPYRD
ncbi:Chs1 predicted chitin synthase [Candida orthopsilosis Co 90-125]|uniref:Chs1 predicted chitin synthase n=1 Tax=Candida orthopsilosis (strain 90-125) TaxID=1136231 RepID=H8XB61_CANO9|nr:Chs1 predicted chitin synthase [Candida orthopsilosis Co 90-125]CCG25309.1 Chs1 predicted chitin synthase [Candida orthopsilosis Co 90-125]